VPYVGMVTILMNDYPKFKASNHQRMLQTIYYMYFLELNVLSR